VYGVTAPLTVSVLRRRLPTSSCRKGSVAPAVFPQGSPLVPLRRGVASDSRGSTDCRNRAVSSLGLRFGPAAIGRVPRIGIDVILDHDHDRWFTVPDLDHLIAGDHSPGFPRRIFERDLKLGGILDGRLAARRPQAPAISVGDQRASSCSTWTGPAGLRKIPHSAFDDAIEAN
jgi:hypothetical protein